MLSSEKMMEKWILKVSTQNKTPFQGWADTDLQTPLPVSSRDKILTGNQNLGKSTSNPTIRGPRSQDSDSGYDIVLLNPDPF